MPIQKLDDHVINQIAAGEVVERPASVVKELMENSIDAGATFIEIEIDDGGKELIQITDNGSGIEPGDFALVFERHATSKIQDLNDLQNVLTMGFRGEALASIGSVAQVSILSRINNQQNGLRIVQIATTITDPEPVAMNAGTIVSVEGLFKNVPARYKYLKGAATETRYITEIILQHAAAHPEIHFRLVAANKVKIDYPATADLLSRSLQVLGVKDADLLIPITYNSQDMQIHGYLGKPQTALKNRNKQYAAVNQRPLNLPFVNHAIKDALHTLIPHNLFPIFLLNIEIDPTAVDVNVHPRKLEARFAYQQFVYQKVKAAVAASLEKHVLTAKLEFGSERTMPSSFTRRDHTPLRQPTVNQALAFNESFSKQVLPEISIQPIAQIDNAYIVGIDSEGLVVIDQHAAHERVMYGRIQEARAKYKQESDKMGQQLLTPLEIELDQSEKAILTEFAEATKIIGFEFNLATDPVQLMAVPSPIQKDDLEAVVRGLISDLQETQTSGVNFKDLETRIERVINYTACRSAIKFGQSLTIEDQKALIAKLDEVESNYTCPHGRPTRIRVTFKDLEKQFGR